MADNASFFHDTRGPFVTTDVTAVTLASTDKALYPASAFPVLGAGYFNSLLGKRLWIHMFGRMTTAATPGNGTWDIYFGSGADATGTIIASSGTLALSANGTNLSWQLDIWVTTRLLEQGATHGALLVTGQAVLNVGLLASTLEPMFIPASAAAQTTVDISPANSNIISVQFKRSGSTAETMQVHELVVTALN
jgi:hypothetical protein